MFYNTKNHTGWFVSVLKNRRKAEKSNKNLYVADDDSDDCGVNQEPAYTEDNAKEDCMFLRTAVVNASNRAEIEEKLVATSDYRKKICMDPENSLLKRFPFFFTHSDLVSIN